MLYSLSMMHSINTMHSLKCNGTSQNVSRSMKCVFNYLVMTMKPRKWRIFPGLFMSPQEILSFLVASARLPGGRILPLETVLRQVKFKPLPMVLRSRRRIFLLSSKLLSPSGQHHVHHKRRMGFL